MVARASQARLPFPYLKKILGSVNQGLEPREFFPGVEEWHSAVAAFTADDAVKRLYLDTARAGGAALWLFSPTEEAANGLVRLLADLTTFCCATTAQKAW
jgi:hypothetical protein